jgi:large subunit ribosomal protein L14e
MPEGDLPPLEPGDVVRSLRGRDRGDVAVVWGILSEHRVAIVDGDRHPIARPKPKNRRHLVRLGHHREIASWMAQAHISDATIRTALLPYRAVPPDEAPDAEGAEGSEAMAEGARKARDGPEPTGARGREAARLAEGRGASQDSRPGVRKEGGGDGTGGQR